MNTSQTYTTKFINQATNNELYNIIKLFLNNLDIMVYGNSIINKKDTINNNNLLYQLEHFEMSLDDYLFTTLSDMLQNEVPDRLSAENLVTQTCTNLDESYVEYKSSEFYPVRSDVVELVECFLNSLDCFVMGDTVYHNSYFYSTVPLVREVLLEAFEHRHDDYV